MISRRTNVKLNSYCVKALISSILFTISLIVFSLSLSLTLSLINSSSIALDQFGEKNGVSFYYLNIFIAILKGLYLISLLCSFIFFNKLLKFSQCIAYWSLISLIFNLVSEALLLKFLLSFNFTNHNLVLVRGCISIFNMMVFLSLPVFFFFSIRNDKEEADKESGICFSLLSNAILIVTSLTIISMNFYQLTSLGPELHNQIGPDNIYLGIFNPREIELIQKVSKRF
jgi:hypothetical protein